MRIELKDKLEKKFNDLKPLNIEKNQEFIDKLLDNYRDTQMSIQEKEDIPLQEKTPTKQEIEQIEKQRQLYLNDLYQVVVKAIIDSAEYLFKLKDKESGEGGRGVDASENIVEKSAIPPENSKEENLVID